MRMNSLKKKKKEFGNLLFSSLRYQLNIFKIKPIRFNCLTLKYKEKAREDKKKNKEREFVNILFSSLRQLNILQSVLFICLSEVNIIIIFFSTKLNRFNENKRLNINYIKPL
jgi:hypothetical protein